MITKTAAEWCNVRSDRDSFATNYFYVQGQYVHHYAHPESDGGWTLATHCHVTGGSQVVTVASRDAAADYVRSFEPTF